MKCARCGSSNRYLVVDFDLRDVIYLCKNCGLATGSGDILEFERFIAGRTSEDWSK
jgi:hypothetical protein